MSRFPSTLRLAVVGAVLMATSFLVAPAANATGGSGGLIFYNSTASPTGYRATLNNGNYASKGPSNFSSGWSNIAISRDTALFYNFKNGLGVTGTYIKGVFTQKHTYHFSLWTQIVASCDTVFFFNYNSQTSAYGTLKSGLYTQRGTRSFTNVTDVVASCDSLLVYNRNGGGALGFPMTGGHVIGNGTLYHLSKGWSRITATDDSVLFVNGSLGAWGQLIAGQFTQTGSSNSFSNAYPVGTNNSVLFYSTLGTAGIATLKSGVYHYVGSLSGFAVWTVISGAK
jgi:hypothetical protein